MIGEARLLGALTRLVRRARAGAVSACAHARMRRVFRFAYGAIHQSLLQEGVTVAVKVVAGDRVGVASTDSLAPRALARCLGDATEIARHAPPRPQVPPLPQGRRLTTLADYAPATARASAPAIAASLKRLMRLCDGAGAALAGSHLTGDDEFAVANSAGVACYAASTVAGAKLVTMRGAASGYASGVHQDLTALDLEALLERALAQALAGREPLSLPIGRYEVILEPEAVADLVAWLGYTGFGAKSVEERTSFLCGRLGEQVTDRRITLYDNGHDPATLRMPFDFEGVPRERVWLIRRGRAEGFVYDSEFGARFGHRSTGHAMPPTETEGPFPLHLVMAPGGLALAEMIRRCRRGLLIPRFHYVNGLMNPRQVLLTGLTREGARLIERGAVTAPIKTLRFTQSLLEALNRVIGISRERRLIADPSQELGCALMPALHLEGFTFTGRSEHAS